MFDFNVDSKSDFRNFLLFVGVLFAAIVLIVIYITISGSSDTSNNRTILYPQGYAKVEKENGKQELIVNRDNINKPDSEIRDELQIDEDIEIIRPGAIIEDRPYPTIEPQVPEGGATLGD